MVKLALLGAGSWTMAVAATPPYNPQPWPMAFTCDFSIHQDSKWSNVKNQGKYFYDWANSHRMLIENLNCTGGNPERRDLECKALHRDGALYGYGDHGDDGKPWCCKWHGPEFTGTPPDWVINGTLLAEEEVFYGYSAAKYRLQKGMVKPVHTYYTLPESGLPLAFVNGFGSTFFFENVQVVDSIDESVFEFPPQSCNAACPWDAKQTASEDLRRKPRKEATARSYPEIFRMLNDFLRRAPSLQLRPCDDFSAGELTELRQQLFAQRSPELVQAYYAAAAQRSPDLHRLDSISLEMQSEEAESLGLRDAKLELAGVEQGAAYLHHTRCLETVLWWQHHTNDFAKGAPIELPLLPEDVHLPPGSNASTEMHEAHGMYRQAIERFECHYDDGCCGADTLVV